MSATKINKEAFVADLEGTTVAEVTAASAVLPLLTFVAVSLLSRRHAAQRTSSPPSQWLLEFSWMALPALAVLTEQIDAFVAAGITGAAAAAAATQHCHRFQGTWNFRSREAADDPRPPCLAWYRAGLLLMTAIAILAVDFHAFPRRFAKAENYGSGLMDVGPGSFVFAQGLMRGVSASSTSARSKASTGMSWGGVMRSAIPLVVIGGVRVAAVKSVEYQEHVSEYGVHWNFFVTLAAVIVLAKVVPAPWDATSRTAAGLLVSALHQAALLAGLGQVVMSDERGPGLMSLNKEGLGSLPGYLALHCLGTGAGGLLRRGLRLGAVHGPLISLGVPLASCMFLWTAATAASQVVEPICRRSCNLAYVLWVAAHNYSALAVYAAADVMCRSEAGSTKGLLPLAKALSNNMLEAFLIANLMTGGVNLSIDTLEFSTAAALAILVLYLLALCGSAVVLEASGLGLRRILGGGKRQSVAPPQRP